MVRPTKDAEDRRVKISSRMDPDLHAWLMGRTGPGKQFKDLAHGLDFAVATLKALEGDVKKTSKDGAKR